MYRRILLKLSGEALMGEQKSGIDGAACRKIASQIVEVRQLGVEIGLVVGGGNIFRGARATGLSLSRTPADQIGMLATLMNGIALQQVLESFSVPVRLMSALPYTPFVEPYIWQEAVRALESGAIVLFVGGTGHPYFTTDSAAALRAIETRSEVLLKATTVDGVYDRDPKESPNGIRFQQVSYSQILADRLQVMDATAIALCRENQMPIRVFDLFSENGFRKAVLAEPIGTLVEGV